MHATPILAFDCATHQASVALRVGETCLSRAIEHGKQASLLVPTIDALLKEQHINYSELGCIITTLGPGSFTGLRIGLATLHGLVLVYSTPVKTITSLEAVAWDVASKPGAPVEFQIVLDAGKGEVFAQRFMRDGAVPKAQGEIAMIAPPLVDTTLTAYGNILAAADPNYIAGPLASALCAIAEYLPTTHIENALPLYIRAPDAKIPKTLPWLEVI